MEAIAPRHGSSAERPSSKHEYVPDEEAIARWAAWYEALPEDLREALDERGSQAGDATYER